MNRIFRVFQVGKLPRARRANLATRSGEALRDPVITKGAFVRSLCPRVDEAAAIRTRLHAIAAAQAVFLVYENDTIGTHESRAHRTHLRAGRVRTLIAHLGNEKILPAVCIGWWKSIFSAIG